MDNVIELYTEFKSELEKQDFIKQQHITITKLLEKNKQLELEVSQLKSLLAAPEVSKIIVTPEQALVDEQINLIQSRSYGIELDLEDVKKLDILLKHKKGFRDSKDLDGKPAIKDPQTLLAIVESQK